MPHRPARLALAALLLGAIPAAYVFAGPPPKAKPPVKPGSGAAPAADPAPTAGGTLAAVEKAQDEKRYEAVLAYAKANPKASDGEAAWKRAIDLASELDRHDAVVEHSDTFLKTYTDSEEKASVGVARAQALGSAGKDADALASFKSLAEEFKPPKNVNDVVSVWMAYASYLTDVDVEAAKKAYQDLQALYEGEGQIGAQLERLVQKMVEPLSLAGSDPKPFPEGVKDLDGKPISYDDYKGKILLIDFWATWCNPCVQEMPNVVDAYKKFHDKGFDVLGISLDGDGAAAAKTAVLKFAGKTGMPWRQFADGKHFQNVVAQEWEVSGIPHTVLIGRDGKIVRTGLRGKSLHKAVEKLLK
jgi:peroxiredoxin